MPALGVARAAYGLPVPSPALRTTPAEVLEKLARRLDLTLDLVLGSVQTPSGSISVRDRAGPRELVWSRAALEDAAQSGWPYLELFHLAAACASQRERALFVGCGGAIAVRQFARVYPGILST